MQLTLRTAKGAVPTGIDKGKTAIKAMKPVGEAIAHAVPPAVKDAGKRGRKALKKATTVPSHGWRIGPVSVGSTPVVIEPVGNKRRRSLVAVAAGAVAAFLLDPTMGKTRRAKLIQGTGGVARAIGRRPAGLRLRRDEPKIYNDQTLQQKVQSEALRADKSHLSIDVADGVVTVRGVCPDPGAQAKIVASIRKIQGVRDVIDLMHEPGVPAPNVRASLNGG